MEKIFDVVIIGGGPAGLTAGIYATRAALDVLLVEKFACGGQALTTDTVENYPGFPDGVSGPALMEDMKRQAERFGLRTLPSNVTKIALKKNRNDAFLVTSEKGETLKALSLIIATGACWNTLGVPGEKELAGRGVSYCATCDGPLFRGKEVVVVGGGDTAIQEALFLSKFASRVTVIHRRDRLRATKILQERISRNNRVSFLWEAVVTAILGKQKVEGVTVKKAREPQETELKADGVFIFVGVQPNSAFLKGAVDLDESGYIRTDNEMRTSAEGIFACGDVRKKLLRQISTAVGEGATAAFGAQQYVEDIRGIAYP